MNNMECRFNVRVRELLFSVPVTLHYCLQVTNKEVYIKMDISLLVTYLLRVRHLHTGGHDL